METRLDILIILMSILTLGVTFAVIAFTLWVVIPLRDTSRQMKRLMDTTVDTGEKVNDLVRNTSEQVDTLARAATGGFGLAKLFAPFRSGLTVNANAVEDSAANARLPANTSNTRSERPGHESIRSVRNSRDLIARLLFVAQIVQRVTGYFHALWPGGKKPDVSQNVAPFASSLSNHPNLPNKRSNAMDDNKSSVGIGSFAIGALAGAIAGILFAPKPGTETREDIKQTLNNLKDEVAVRLSELKEFSQDNYQGVVNSVLEGYEKAKHLTAEQVTQLRQDLMTAYETVKDTAEEGSKKLQGAAAAVHDEKQSSS